MRALIYDSAILPLTTSWYRHVLRRVPRGTHLLDVGIGTGGALVRNRHLVMEREIRVTGVDIDADYVRRCRRRIERRGMAHKVDVVLESIYDHRGGPYDAAYFSSSFMLMPRPLEALRHVLGLVPADAPVFFTLTFQERRSQLMERTKPMIRKLTTIDFGEVTYEEDFRGVLEGARLEVREMSTLLRTPTMSGRLVVVGRG